MPKLKLIAFTGLFLVGCLDQPCDPDEAVLSGFCRSCELLLPTTAVGTTSSADFNLRGSCGQSVSGLVLLEQLEGEIIRIVDLVLPAEVDSVDGSFRLTARSDQPGEFTATLVIQNTRAEDEVHPVQVQIQEGSERTP